MPLFSATNLDTKIAYYFHESLNVISETYNVISLSIKCSIPCFNNEISFVDLGSFIHIFAL